jgi:hypothetical protein
MLTPQAELTIPLSLISTIYKRSNYALWGGIAGAVLGGVGGAYWANNGCETCSGSDKTVAAVGGVVGGAILGASAGNALPTWKELYFVRYPKASDEKIDSRPSATAIRKPTYGRASLFVGYASPTERDLFDGAFGGRINIMSEVFSNILIGPEFGYYSLGSDTVFTADSTRRVLESVWQLNLIGRIDGNVAFLPLYLLGGAGLHSANDGSDFWGYTFGLGTILADAPVAVGAEVRWTSNITDPDVGETVPDGILSLTAGLEYKW